MYFITIDLYSSFYQWISIFTIIICFSIQIPSSFDQWKPLHLTAVSCSMSSEVFGSLVHRVANSPNATYCSYEFSDNQYQVAQFSPILQPQVCELFSFLHSTFDLPYPLISCTVPLDPPYPLIFYTVPFDSPYPLIPCDDHCSIPKPFRTSSGIALAISCSYIFSSGPLQFSHHIPQCPYL